jgi:peptidoglycan/LPS O-acetylase OafA/YrhL
MASERIFGLDLLRVLAIFGVVIPHALPALYPYWYKLGILGHGGFYGVELFFVLSGFLIAGVLIRTGQDLSDHHTLLNFYSRRWFRTLPLFWLFFIVNLGIEIVVRDHRLSSNDVLGHLFFLRNFSDVRMAFFPESWSLAVEEWFYLLFPAVLAAGLYFTKRFNLVLLWTSLAFYTFSTVERALAASGPGITWSGAPRVVVLYRFDALMAGVVAAWTINAFPTTTRRMASVLALAGSALLVWMYSTLWVRDASFVTSAPESYFGQSFRFNLISLGFALLLPACSNWIRPSNAALSRLVRCLAQWSYSMYLAHWPVFYFVQQKLFSNGNTSKLRGCALFLCEIALTILVSAFLFILFERPITGMRPPIVPARAR